MTGGKHCSEDEEFKTEVQKWTRQHSKYHYVAGFNILVM
jgi:hypothetical protein